MMVVFFVDTIVYLLSGIRLTEFAITRAIAGGFIFGYVFLILYSLYVRFRDDRTRHVYPTQVQYHQPGQKM